MSVFPVHVSIRWAESVRLEEEWRSHGLAVDLQAADALWARAWLTVVLDPVEADTL